MSNVKLSNNAKAILESFCKINPQMRIRNDYLYTKSDETGTVGVFELKDGDVEIPEEFGIYKTDELLSIFKLFEDEPEINLVGSSLRIKNGKKAITYQTCPLEMIPKRNTKGVELFEGTPETLMSVVLDELTLKEISSIKSKLDMDVLKLVAENGKVKVVTTNSVTDNSVEIEVEGTASDDVTLVFSDINIFDNLMDGIYTIIIKDLDVGKTKKPFAKLEFKTSDDIGNLYYFCGLSK